ncbi:MAG: hypothetical protein HY555_02250 [Euryarchaeota archaeon]|nr:hypothetical protein [Euryarchaeota archaeon]
MGEVDSKVEKIIHRIEEDTEAKAKALTREAEGKARAIISEAEGKAAETRSGIVGRGEREAEQERQRILANAKLRERKAKLDAKEEVIKEAFGLAEEKLKEAASGKEYQAVLKNLLQEAVASLGSGSLVVMGRKEDAKHLKEVLPAVAKGLKLSNETISAAGGVIVKTEDGRVEVNNTFETRLARLRDDLRPAVSKILFEGSA